jgi:hypothetical protein
MIIFKNRVAASCPVFLFIEGAVGAIDPLPKFLDCNKEL